MRPVVVILDELRQTMQIGKKMFIPLAVATRKHFPGNENDIQAVEVALEKLEDAFIVLEKANQDVVTATDVVIAKLGVTVQ